MKRLSYANVTATIALFAAVASGTTALAGVAKAPKNSVVAKSIKNGNVTAKDVTTTQVVNSTTTVTDPSPLDGQYVGGNAVARCPQGARAINGGGTASGGFLTSSVPSGGDGWLVVAATDNAGATQIHARVVCLLATPGNPTQR
jgi:hypothetical protein